MSYPHSGILCSRECRLDKLPRSIPNRLRYLYSSITLSEMMVTEVAASVSVIENPTYALLAFLIIEVLIF